MGYAVGIPTCDRDAVLAECLQAFDRQTLPPDYIVVVNNNRDGHVPVLPKLDVQVSIINNRYSIHGPEQAHQTVFEYFKEVKTDIGVRWDDDLIPRPGCMEALYKFYDTPAFEGCVGGCYPRAGFPIWENRAGRPLPLNHPLSHIQFFEWHHKAHMCVTQLYSGFMYRVAGVHAAGGFCIDYSTIGYKGETDLTLRIHDSGRKCVIQPSAVALHKLAEGGIRVHTSAAYKMMADRDQALFQRRMNSLCIDWKI